MSDPNARFTKEHEGRRVQYEKRDGLVRYGTIREVLSVSASNTMIDVVPDPHNMNWNRKNYIPQDMVKLLDENHPEYERPST